MPALPDRFVLHPGVAALWWLRDTRADRAMLDALIARGPGGDITCLDDIDWHVLDRVSREFWPPALPRVELGPVARTLSDDIAAVVSGLVESGVVMPVRWRVLQAPGFHLAVRHEIPLVDAMCAALAVAGDRPLLVADEATRTVLQAASDDPAYRFEIVVLDDLA